MKTFQMSQSAFAGYGLEARCKKGHCSNATGRNPLSLDMGWKQRKHLLEMPLLNGRNPLSLDMGWKEDQLRVHAQVKELSQSAFAGYGLEEELGIRNRWIK